MIFFLDTCSLNIQGTLLDMYNNNSYIVHTRLLLGQLLSMYMFMCYGMYSFVVDICGFVCFGLFLITGC